jgi:hypothetical protein
MNMMFKFRTLLSNATPPPRAIEKPWQAVVIIPRISDENHVQISDVAQARDPPRPVLRGRKRREEQRRQNADDGDDHQQLDEREAHSAFCTPHSAFHRVTTRIDLSEMLRLG